MDTIRPFFDALLSHDERLAYYRYYTQVTKQHRDLRDSAILRRIMAAIPEKNKAIYVTLTVQDLMDSGYEDEITEQEIQEAQPVALPPTRRGGLAWVRDGVITGIILGSYDYSQPEQTQIRRLIAPVSAYLFNHHDVTLQKSSEYNDFLYSPHTKVYITKHGKLLHRFIDSESPDSSSDHTSDQTNGLNDPVLTLRVLSRQEDYSQYYSAIWPIKWIDEGADLSGELEQTLVSSIEELNGLNNSHGSLTSLNEHAKHRVVLWNANANPYHLDKKVARYSLKWSKMKTTRMTEAMREAMTEINADTESSNPTKL